VFMWRPFAAALFCAYFTFVGIPVFFDWIEQSAAPSRPSVYGHVRPIDRSAHRTTAPHLEAVSVVRPFDPDIYRGGRVGEPLSLHDICEVVAEAAAENNISLSLFARLIWQESRFRNETVSRAGAQGIAQFMPETAAERGLDDPFDPLQALPASAQFLRQLTDRFGNFGLAAAAYNGGPQRVKDWLAGRGRLPKETREYVLRITGREAEYWAKAPHVGPHSDELSMHLCALTLIRAAAEIFPQNRH
jgi:Transglycosylase SLT domain